MSNKYTDRIRSALGLLASAEPSKLVDDLIVILTPKKRGRSSATVCKTCGGPNPLLMIGRCIDCHRAYNRAATRKFRSKNSGTHTGRP